MTALYCYMVSFYNYSGSEFLPIFHERKLLKKKVKTLEDTIEGLTGTIVHYDLEEVLEKKDASGSVTNE